MSMVVLLVVVRRPPRMSSIALLHRGASAAAEERKDRFLRPPAAHVVREGKETLSEEKKKKKQKKVMCNPKHRVLLFFLFVFAPFELNRVLHTRKARIKKKKGVCVLVEKRSFGGTRRHASVQRDSATAGDVPNGHQWQFLGAESARNRREQRDGHRIIETGPTREIEVDRVSGVFWNREIDVRVSLSRGE